MSEEKKVVLVVESYATNEYADSPSWAKLVIDQALLDKIQNLAGICNAHDLCEVSQYHDVDWDEKGIELRLRGDRLLVSSTIFWFSAYPKYGDYFIETRSIAIQSLVSVFEAVTSGKAVSEVSGEFFYADGIVFYDASCSESLSERYFEDLSEEVEQSDLS